MKAPVATNLPAVPTRVLCVDDSSDITLVLQMLIDAEPMMECVGCLASANGLIERVRALNPPPDVVLLDATIPGEDPLRVMQQMAAELPAVKCIVYSGYHDVAFVDRVKSFGASGCVSKREEPEVVLQAVREVAAGGAWWPQPSYRH